MQYIVAENIKIGDVCVIDDGRIRRWRIGDSWPDVCAQKDLVEGETFEYSLHVVTDASVEIADQNAPAMMCLLPERPGQIGSAIMGDEPIIVEAKSKLKES